MFITTPHLLYVVQLLRIYCMSYIYNRSIVSSTCRGPKDLGIKFLFQIFQIKDRPKSKGEPKYYRGI